MSEAEEFKNFEEMLEKVPEEDLPWIIVFLLLFNANLGKSENKETKEDEK